MRRIFFLIVLAFTLLSVNHIYAQTSGVSVGKNGEAPNQYARFEVVDSNRGILIPRVTESQRLNINPDNTAEGLLVYETDSQSFWYFTGTDWIQINAGMQYQNLTVIGDSLFIGNGNGIAFPEDNDPDPLNEIQTLSYVNDTIWLSNGGSYAALPDFNDDDSDSLNEIQVLSFLNDTIWLSKDGGFVELPAFTDDDSDSTNEIQDLELIAGTTLRITNNASATEINLAPFVGTNTDEQILTFTSATKELSISNGNTVTLDMSDNDADATNEIQDLQLTGSTLTITNNASATDIVLADVAISGDFNDLTNQPTPYSDADIDGTEVAFAGWDKDASDDFDGQYTSLTGAPTNVSDLINDAGYLTAETDPVFTAWDKSSGISITESQISDLSHYSDADIDGTEAAFAGWDKDASDDFDGQYSSLTGAPTNVSDLINDAGYLTAETDPVFTAWDKSSGISITESQISDLSHYSDADIDGTETAFAGWDKDASDDFSGVYGDLSGLPTQNLTTDYCVKWDGTDFANSIIQDNGTNVGIGGAPNASYVLYVNGKFKSNGVDEISDARYKTNIKDLGTTLETVKQMRGVTYDWNHDAFPEKNFPERNEIGFIAQEVEKYFPELVTTDEDGYKTVQYSRLVPVLLEAIKELNALIETQQQTITKLEADAGRIDAVESQLKTVQIQVRLLQQLLESSTASK